MRSTTALFICAGALACGGTAKPPAPRAPEPESDEVARPSGMQMQTELGVLDEGQVRSTFERLWKGAMKACAKGDVFGDVTITIRVNHQGETKWAFMKESTLGSREAEKCILDAARSASWPIPEGGEDGIAEQQLPFPEGDKRPPVAWPSDRVAETVSGARSKLQGCLGSQSGQFIATAVVNTDGSPASVGIAVADEEGERVADCVVDTLMELKYPSPGSWPAKVSFPVP